MVRAQNDLYMVCPDGSKNANGDNTLEALAEGKVTRAELQRSAMNICRFAMHTEAMRRLMGEKTEVEILNRPKYEDDFDMDEVLKEEQSHILYGDIIQLGRHRLLCQIGRASCRERV